MWRSPDPLAQSRHILDNYSAGLAAAKVPHAVLLSSVGSQQASGNGPIAGTHYGEVVLASWPPADVRARRILHGEHPQQRRADEVRRRVAGVRRRRELSVPDGRDARHRRHRRRCAARAADRDAMDSSCAARATTASSTPPRPRARSSGAACEGDALPIEAAGADADEARHLGELRRASTARWSRRSAGASSASTARGRTATGRSSSPTCCAAGSRKSVGPRDRLRRLCAVHLMWRASRRCPRPRPDTDSPSDTCRPRSVVCVACIVFNVPSNDALSEPVAADVNHR